MKARAVLGAIVGVVAALALLPASALAFPSGTGTPAPKPPAPPPGAQELNYAAGPYQRDPRARI